MNARQFYNMAVKMRKAQRDYDKLPSTRNKMFKQEYEGIIDREIERVETIKLQEANNQQQTLL
jgi:hypothetical protein